MILVTGASGTVGSEVVKVLVAGGVRFRAGYRTRPQNIPEAVDSVALDYGKPETIPPRWRGWRRSSCSRTWSIPSGRWWTRRSGRGSSGS